MRTTVDLPDGLMRTARIRASERGENLKDLFTRALEREVAAPSPRRRGSRMTLPLIGTPDAPTYPVTGADIEDVLAAEVSAHYGLPGPSS